MIRILTILVLIMGVTFLGCGAGDMASSKEGAADWDENHGNTQEPTSPGEGEEPPPPETEIDFSYKAPQASEHYVYVAATSRDSLVRIDAETLEIRLIPVGGQPTRVATLPAGDVALVINSGTQDLSMVVSSAEDDEVSTIDMLPDVNAIAVSPDGEYAIVYYNDLQADPGDPEGDRQTVAVVSLKDGEPNMVMVSIGFHPTAVYFHESMPRAHLVTDDGISVIDLDEAQNGDISTIVPVSDDIMEDASLREVLITDNGKYAVVRNLAHPKLAVVDLHSGQLKSMELDGLPTDVDLIPGEDDKALVVLREAALAYIIDLDLLVAADEEGDRADATVEIDIDGSYAGAAVVTEDATRAVLYTTVGGVKAVSLMDLTAKDYDWKPYPVQKGVAGVAVSLEGMTAVVLHEKESFDPADTDLSKSIASSEGFTLFDLETGYRKLIQSEHRWTEYLFVKEATGADLGAYILAPDPAGYSHQVLNIDLQTYLVDKTLLISEPTSLVFVPKSRKVAVAQEHENGRVTFIDVDTKETYSVTGYELNGLIN